MLTERESEVVRAALRASVEGPFFPDWEFPTLMGVDRDEMRKVLETWPDVTDVGLADRAINNALVNLLGYPHNEWEAWRDYSDADEDELDRVFRHWRSEADSRAERDRRLIEAGEPPWGDVVPGTDEVEYFTVSAGLQAGLLFRTVAKEGAFYVETYAGQGNWKVDSEPMTYLMSRPGEPMLATPLAGRDAARLMAQLDGGGPGEQGTPID